MTTTAPAEYAVSHLEWLVVIAVLRKAVLPMMRSRFSTFSEVADNDDEEVLRGIIFFPTGMV
jgi:hypothetical protein